MKAELGNLGRKALTFAHACCGWLFAYIGIMGAAGFLFDRPWVQDPTCLPSTGVFGVLETNCENQFLDFFWAIAVEIPRLVIVFPAGSFSLFKAALKNGGYGASYLPDAFHWLALSIPLILVALVGWHYWNSRSKYVAALLITGLTAEILWLGWRI